MSVPGFPSVMSFYSSLGEKEVVFMYVCTWLPSVSCLFYLPARWEKVILAVVRSAFRRTCKFFLTHVLFFPDSCSFS